MAASCDKPAHATLLPLQHLVEHLRAGADQTQQAWLLEAVFAEHAHQLAERIREAAHVPEGHEWTVWNAGAEDAADLIDPEVPMNRNVEESMS